MYIHGRQIVQTQIHLSIRILNKTIICYSIITQNGSDPHIYFLIKYKTICPKN